MPTPRDAAASCRLRDYMDTLAEGSVYEADAAERERFALMFIEEVAAYEEQGPDYLDHAVTEKRDRLVAWRDVYRDGLAAKEAELVAEQALCASETAAGRDGPDDTAFQQCLVRIAAIETWLNYRLGLKSEFGV